MWQVFHARWIHVISRQSARRRLRQSVRQRHVRMVSIRLQLGTGDRGKRSLAALWTFRRRAECQGELSQLVRI